jgi:predicted  nucleic acid-binding Zn-ribbon protein
MNCLQSKDVRRLLKNKEYIETAMQRADPLMRLVMQRQLDVVCGEIEEAREEWHKSMEHVSDLLEENYALKNRIAELEREVQDYKEENVKLLQQCLSLYRAVKKANCNLDAIEKSCDNNVWFQKIKERTY